MIIKEFKEIKVIEYYTHKCRCDICDKEIKDGETYWNSNLLMM